MLRLLLILSLLMPSSIYAQPVDSEIQEVQLFFGQITELECCTLINQGAKAPYKGFLLSPYQLVFLKDAIDTWDTELQLQLKHVNDLCDSKLEICQTNRDDLLDQMKLELSHCTDTTSTLQLENQDLLKTNTTLKGVLYISIPLSIVLGIYIGSKF